MTGWIERAERPVMLFGVEIHRFGLAEAANRLIEKTGIPCAVMLLDKSALDERLPSYLGVYAGQMGREEVRAYVEESDCVILLGTLLTDVNLGGFTAQLDPARCIHATQERLAVGLHSYERIDFAELIEALAAHPWTTRELPPMPEREPEPTPELAPGDPITVAHLFQRLGRFLDDDTIVIADPGDALFGAIDLPVHGSAEFLAPAYYASLGFAVPAAIGAQFGAPDRRPLVLVGDGAFQMTGMELSTIAKYGLDPVVVVLNNGGYTTERLILDGAFNDIQPWDFAKLPELLGAGRAYTVRTAGDLEAALEGASKRGRGFALIEVCLDRLDFSPALRRLGERLNAAAEARA
jgi:indolepyruvate decarboxylase